MVKTDVRRHLKKFESVLLTVCFCVEYIEQSVSHLVNFSF